MFAGDLSADHGARLPIKKLFRGAARRLAIIQHVEEVTGNIAMTYCYFRISRHTYYYWLCRYQELGPAGLRERSRWPQVCPHATEAEVVSKNPPPEAALPLRSSQDRHVPQAVSRRLGEPFRGCGDPEASKPEPATRFTTLKRHAERWKRYEKQQPGHGSDRRQLHRANQGQAQKHYEYTAIDDCTRLRVLRIYERLDQKTAIRFVDYVLERLPFKVMKVQTANGSEFQAGFHWHLLDKGIQHVYIRPSTPRLNGKVERSHRIADEEFYRLSAGEVIDDATLFKKLHEWERFYNFARPHGALEA